MGQLTVKEREHWKERIGRKLDRAIEALYAKNDSTYLERIRHKARQQALESLRLNELQTRLDEIDAESKVLDKEKRAALQKMVAIVNGVETDEVTAYLHARPHEINRAIQKRQELHERELMNKDPLGRKILALQNEKEELLDTVWLATSSKQIKELWQHVSELLSQEPTRLQKEALEIGPVETE